MSLISAMRLRPIAAIVLALTAAAAPAAAQDARPDQPISLNVGLQLRSAQSHIRAEQYAEAIRAIDLALDAGPLTPSELGVALYLRGQANYALGDAPAAATDWNRALSEGQLSQEVTRAVQTALQQVADYLGDDATGGYAGVASNLYFEGQEAFRDRDLDRASDLLNRALSAAEEGDDLYGKALAHGGLGYVALSQGDWEGALQSFDASAAAAREGDAPEAIYFAALYGRAQALQQRAWATGGDLGEAEDAFRAILSYLEDLPTDRRLVDVLGNLGALALQRKDYEAAADHLERVLEHSGTLNYPDVAQRAVLSLAAIARLQGDSRLAGERLARFSELASEAGDPTQGAELLEQAAVATRMQGDDEVACWFEDQARDAYRRTGRLEDADAVLAVMEASGCE